MKVKVVGSGSMWNKYNSACYLIDNNIMVDFPNGACKYLYREDINSNIINHILITHFHGDHYFDLPFYILNKARSINKDVVIYCSKDGKKKINKLGLLAFPNSFKDACNSFNLRYNFNDEFKIEDYVVYKILVDHGRMKPAYGYVFEKNNKFVGFTGDTCLCDSVEEMAQQCNYLFCDCMFELGTNKHQGINDIKYLANKYANCIFVVSHMENKTRELLSNLNLKNVIVPEDGIIIEI